MADGRVEIDTRLNTSGFDAGINSLEKSLKKIGALIVATFSIGAIKNFVKETKSLYQVQMENELKLQTIMKQRMGATDDLIQSVKDLASEEQRLGVIGDEVQLAGMQQLATFSSQADTLKILLPAMNNLLAQQNGLNSTTSDAVNIGNLMGKVLQGQTSALKRVGISFTDAQEQVLKYGTESERASVLAQVITDNVGNMNYALAQTDAGKQQQLANTMGDVKEQFGQAFQTLSALFIPALSRLAQLVNDLSVKFIALANAIRKAFGGKEIKVATGGSGMSGGVEGYTDATDDATDSTNALAKAQHKLSSIDELNVISKDTGSGTSALSSSGGGISGGLADGEETEDATKGISGLLSVLEPFSNIDLSNVINALDKLKDALSQLGKNLGNGLKWIYDNVLVPLAKWTIEDAIPKFLNILTSAINLLNSAISNAQPYLQWFWDNFLSKLFEFAGDIALNVLDDIAEFLQFVADHPEVQTILAGILATIMAFKLEATVVTGLSTMSTALNEMSTLGKIAIVITVAVVGWEIGQKMYETITGNSITESAGQQMSEIFGAIQSGEIWDALTLMCQDLWTEIQGIFAPVVSFFAGIGTSILSIFTNLGANIEKVFSPFTAFFSKIGANILGEFMSVGTGVSNAFTNAWITISSVFDISKVKTFFSNVCTGIKMVFTSIPSWFKTRFENAWKGVRDVFSKGGEVFKGITDGIFETFKTVVNTLIDGINEVVSIPFKAIDGALSKLRDVKIVGKHPFSFLPTIDAPEIPHLAQGGVIPPNKEFLAVLGDQKSGTNIETPLETMVEAFTMALDSRGNADGDINLYLDGDKLFNWVRGKNTEYIARYGQSAF